MNNICQYAKRLWELYMFGETPEEAQELLEAMDEKISIIGTGKHEFYEELAAFADALGMEEPEREAIQFHIQSIWAKEQAVSDGVKLVYGGLHVTGTGRYAEVAVDMDTRYTMVFQRTAKEESGQKEVWKLVHIHQSLPYIDQQEGEYYPKTLLDQVGEVRTLTCGEMQFGYRTSLAKKKGYIVLGAELTLKQGEKEKIREEMQTLKAKRIEKQPLEFPSAGSTFKRPEGYFAGKLIMDAGLRGAAVGGAQVSEKHCGFVVNTGNATAADVRELMRQVQGKVQEQFGVHLEPEVRFLGEF